MANFKKRQELRRELTKHDSGVEKMFTFMRGLCSDKHNAKTETMRALGYMREKHGSQKRDDGEPYIVHPLSMVCMAVGLGLTDDILMAVILLHDVCEDAKTNVKDLPFSEDVKQGVKYMTIESFPGDVDKNETKRRYYHMLLDNKNALFCKALDRYSNLCTMVGVFSEEKIVKNIRETHELLLPVLKEAKEIYPEWTNEFFILRTILRNLNDNLAIIHGVSLY